VHRQKTIDTTVPLPDGGIVELDEIREGSFSFYDGSMIMVGGTSHVFKIFK